MLSPRFQHFPGMIALALSAVALAFSLHGAPQTEKTAAKSTASNVTFNEAQAQDIGKISREYLLANPEVIREAIQALQAKEEAAKADLQVEAVTKFKDQIFADPASPVAGNPNGDVTVVEFFDYKCPYCKQVTPALEGLLKADPNLKIVFKEFPILGDPSVLASRAALAAVKQGKYLPFHQAMMAHRGAFDLNAIAMVAAGVGLNADQLVRDMDTDEIKNQLTVNHELAQALSIRSTPTFIVGDQVVPGALSIDALRDLIAEARKGS
jgi:protein-disulfide isomerase